MRPSVTLLLALAAVMASGCSPSRGGNATASDGGNATASFNASLVNTSWTVITLDGAQTPAGKQPTMTFAADGTVSGNASCNQYSGTYQLDGGRISIANVSSTLMLCEGAFGNQEALFLKAMNAASEWHRPERDRLEMAGAISLVAAPGIAVAPPEATSGLELPGTTWALTEMAGTADFAHLVPTLIFGADGRVSGFSGCNTFNGTYFADGRIVSLMSTKRGCPPPASTIEAAYLDALSSVTSWTVADGNLRMDGPVPLTFAPS